MFKNKVKGGGKEANTSASTSGVMLGHDLLQPPGQDVCVDLRGGDIGMSQKLLN